MWKALCERYGADAEIVSWIDSGGVPHVRIDGKTPEDVHPQVSIGPDEGLAWVFLAVENRSFERYGTTRWGTAMAATLPLLA